ncbi:MAG: VOC family protein [Bdellovibrionia bacterium]
MDMKLEVVVLPVADLDRSKDFYTRLGWRLDADGVYGVLGEGFRVVQLTPPGSPCSIHLVKGNAVASPVTGWSQANYLVVSDIEAARKDLMNHGVGVGQVFHSGDRGGLLTGPDPERRSYFNLLTFSDPDGYRWLIQEVTQRRPGRIDSEAMFASRSGLADALRRAAAAHGRYEESVGQRDENWPEWYADYLFREQSGEESAA